MTYECYLYLCEQTGTTDPVDRQTFEDHQQEIGEWLTEYENRGEKLWI